MKLTVNRDIDLTLTPEEIAKGFWHLHSDEQVVFFNTLATLAEHMLCMQLQWVTDDENLTLEGRMAMKTIGDYAGKQI